MKFLKIFLMLFLFNTILFSSGTQSFTKEVEGSLNRDIGEIISFTLKSSCSSLTGDCGDLEIIDTLPAGLVIESCEVPTGFTATQCTKGESEVIINKDTVFNGGDSFLLTIKALVPLDTLEGASISNSATATITSADDSANASTTTSSGSLTMQNKTNKWSVSKVRTSPSLSLKPTWDTDVSYKVEFCSDTAVGNVNLSSVTMQDVFPANAEVINADGGTISNNILTWNLGDILLVDLYGANAYTTQQCIVKNYTLRYPNASFGDGDAILNTVTVTGTPNNGQADISEEAFIDETIGIPTPGANLSKSANDVLPNSDMAWSLNFNIDSSNAPVPNLVVYEELPLTVGLEAVSISSGQWNSPATTNEPIASRVTARISSATDSAGDCANANYTTLSAGFIPSPAIPDVYNLESNTTCIKWEFQDDGADGPSVPRGWETTTSPVLIQTTSSYTGAFPIEISNCLLANFTNFDNSIGSSTVCATANIEEATPEIITSKSASSSSLKPGDTTQYTLRFRHDTADSTGATVNPIITDLLPPEMQFVSWDEVNGLNGKNEPNLEKIENYNGTGKTLLRFSWADTAPINSVMLNGSIGLNNPETFEEGNDVNIKFTVQVKAGTLANSYSNTMQFFDNSARQTCDGTPIADSDDLDGDGDTSEEICSSTKAVTVLDAAVIGGSKWIRGIDALGFVDASNPSVTNNALCVNDNNFTQTPCVAQTLRGETFEYLFKLVNVGNKELNEYIFYDLLPYAGDVGTSEALSTTDRGSEWRPTLDSIVTAENQNTIDAMAQTGSVIEYSTASNPCRPEVSSSADESGWQGSCTDDWGVAPIDLSTVTAIKIKLPFADSTWKPIDELQFKLRMKAPYNAYLSKVELASKIHPAWNSFAHRATQASNNERLLAAEPTRVGIVVPAGPPVSMGSIAWKDKNNNGIQDVGEELLNESTTFKLVDVNGTEVRDNENVLVKVTTSTGKYFFDDLPEGNYSVVVTPPSTYGAANIQTDQDNNNTENDSNIKSSSNGGYTSGVFELTQGTQPIESDTTALANTDDADDSDETSGNMTVDFGFYKPAQLGNFIWLDNNQDGLQDSDEPGVADINVTLYKDCVTPIESQVTTSTGKYLFYILEPGDYCVGFSNLPVGYFLTQNSTDDTLNSDIDSTETVEPYLTSIVSLEGGDVNLDLDLGITAPIISGNIFADGDGDSTVNGDAISSLDGTNLYVLLCQGNTKLSSKIITNGTYIFYGEDGVKVDSNYTVVLSTSNTDCSVSLLANNWNHADGEEIGSTGLDGLADGKINVEIIKDNVVEVNFGINKKPVAQNITEATQFNPGGTTEVAVPDLNVSDNEDGIPAIVTIKSLANNGTLYYNGTAVVLDQNISDVSKLTIDPNAGAVTVTFTYSTTDRVGVESDIATVTLPFKDLKVSGNVFIDGNGDGNIDGTPTGSADGMQLYITLVNGGSAVASMTLSAGGTYEFNIEDGVQANTTYTVVLSDSNGSINASLPIEWSNEDGEKSENTKTNGKDSSNGSLVVEVIEVDVLNNDFGINKKPVAEDVSEPAQVNPGNSSNVNVPNLNISDEQTTSGLTVTITTLPNNAILYYNGNAVTANQNISNFDNSLLTIDPQSGDQNISFNYTATDGAGTVSDSATVTLAFTNIIISGTLFNDGNGNGNVDGNETNVADTTVLFVTLLDANGLEVASKALLSDGTYYFDSADGLSPDSNYTVVLTDLLHKTTAFLPTNWNNADGENIGLIGLDGNDDGIVSVKLLRENIPNINFGINKKPMAETKIEASQFNLGNKIQVVVPDLNASDKEDRRPTTITITQLPNNGTLYYDGVAVVANVEIGDFNGSKFTFDPNDGDITAVFKYTATDRAGVSSDEATITIPFVALKIKGNVFNDGNNDGTVNGLGISAPNGIQLYVTLVDVNGTVITSHKVNADGSYAFENEDNLVANTSYSVILSTSEDNTTANLPINWSNFDGEHIGTDMGTDGSSDGRIAVSLLEEDVLEVNFGINKKPTAEDYTEPLQLNPGTDVKVPVVGMVIADNEDTIPSMITIETIPSHGVLYYGGVAVTAEQNITDFNTSLLTLDPDNGEVTVSFTYTSTDAVGDKSNIATISMSFAGLEIKGNIFDDGNNDNRVNGTKISKVNRTTLLYATLLDDSGVVMASMPINADGSYGFNGVDGIVPNTNYTIVLSIEENATTAMLPSNWNNADGEHIGTDVGLDGNADGMLAVEVGSSDVEEVNFGINEQPVAEAVIADSQINPGSSTTVQVTDLNVSDKEDAEPTTITITELASNGTLYYDGVAVVANVEIKDFNGSKFRVDPNNGDVTVSFKYTTTDEVGVVSEVATVRMPFVGLKISGNVFNDGNDDGRVNGVGISAPNGVQLYVTLLDVNGTVIASHNVLGDGSYLFDSNDYLIANSTYKVVLSISENNITAGVPTNWFLDEDIDGGKDGEISVLLLNVNIEEQNFGINKKPVAGDVSAEEQLNPGTNGQVAVPTLNITDNEDTTPSTVTIINVPVNGTLYYNGTAVTAGQIFRDFNNSLLTLDPDNGDQVVSFTYTTTDVVGDESEEATVSMSFAGLEIKGNIFDDGNNDNRVNGTKISKVNRTTLLYATLLDDSGVVMASMPINADGSYGFNGVDGIVPNTNYTIVLSIEENATTAMLPSNWNNADGEHIGTDVGLDGNADGMLAVEVGSSDVEEANFGINEQPVAMDKTEEVALNLGATKQVSIPNLNILDKEDNTTARRVTVTTLPTNGRLYYASIPVVANVEIVNFDPSKFTLDPNDGDLTVAFKYRVTDRGGLTSNKGTMVLPFIALKIKGNIFNDGNNDGTINGTGISAPNGVQLYVNLVDEKGQIKATHAVNSDGSYVFGGVDGIISDTNYEVILSTKENSTVADLPINWSNLDGEHIGTNIGTDASPDGTILVPVLKEDIVQVNFGINKKPLAIDHTEALQLNPGGNVQVPVVGVEARDNEDARPSTITIETVPSHGTLYYNGTQVQPEQVILNFDASLLTLDPNNGDQIVSFTYTSTDIVGVKSEIATVSMSFDGLEISGNIFADGSNDNRVNGTKISKISERLLYAMLLDESGILIGSKPISDDGSYLFTGKNGIVPNSEYTVLLSTEENATSSTLLSNWNHADGEHIGTDAGLDGKADGQIVVAVLESDIKEVNFGVNQRPIAIDKTEPKQLNPGSDRQVAVPPLEINDNEDGIPNIMTITTLPSNGTLYYDSKLVEVDVAIESPDLTKFTIDPNNGDLNVSFMYTSTDRTGWESEEAKVTLEFSGLELSGQIFMDSNGDGDVEGIPLTSAQNLPLFVSLVDSNGSILVTVPVNTDGTYLFDPSTGIRPNRDYRVVLSSEKNSSDATLPSNWVHSLLENNGIILVSIDTRNISDINFGLNQQPVVLDVIAPSVVNPGGKETVVVPSLNIPFNEDGTTRASTITLTNLPSNAIVYYSGEVVAEGQIFTDFNNSLLTIDPDDANITVEFSYTSTDDAGLASEPAIIRMSFSDIDSDGDGIPNNQDLDDDNDGILDVVENNTSFNDGDTDSDGILDRLDLDADGDGILDLEESNPTFETVDSNGDGVLDSTTDSDHDGIMDTADADDTNRTSEGSVIPIDTDNDGKPDFQDVDSDNDGLSDLVEGGTDAHLDVNTDGILDEQIDTDKDGISDVVDVNNGGTPANTPDTDKDGTDNYRDLDSDGDTLLDVIEIGGTDTNNDGHIDPVGTLISGVGLPDENNNGIPDVLEIKLKDDSRTAAPSEVVTIDLLENDSGDVDKRSVQLMIPKGFKGIARLSRDRKRMVVDGEGEWSVDEKGILTFTPEAGFRASPTPIQYKAFNIDGTKSAVANVTITVTDVAGASTEVCETYSETSIPVFGGLSLVLLLLLSTLFGMLLIRKER